MSVFNSSLRDDLYEKISELEQKLEKKAKIIELLKQSNEFYGSSDNWSWVNNNRRNLMKEGSDLEHDNNFSFMCAGKLARSIAEKIKELENE